MDNHESAGQAQRSNNGASPYSALGAQSNPSSFNDQGYMQDGQQQNNSYFLGPTYTDFQEQQQTYNHPSSQGSDITGHTFLQSQGFGGQVDTSGFAYNNHSAHASNHVSPSALSHHNSPGGNSNPDTSSFPTYDFNQPPTDHNASLDPSLLSGIDPSAIDLLGQQQGADNAGDSLNPMATLQSHPHSPTPPHLLPEMAQRRQSASPSPQTSPNFQQASFGNNLNRPRGTSESLDPSSALYPQADWSNMGAYRGHRRTPSDNYSDYSSHSAQASPYLPTYDNFDAANAHSSPMLNPVQDPVFGEGLGFQHFNLNEGQQQQQSHHSPGHSPHISPRLMAQQQALPLFSSDNNFGLNPDMDNQFVQQQNGQEMYQTGEEPFPLYNTQNSPNDFGNADQMSPPEISIDYAPPPNNTADHTRPDNDGEALSPPNRVASRNRMRAKSDSAAGSRSPSPSLSGRGRSPSLQPVGADKLSPFDNAASSRSPSPSRGRNGSLSRARSSSHASDQRDYYLNLADPPPPGSQKDNGRVQKHPATFQCHLCPKRFTRAYNLRSHLRTHTDERPFVCTVCGKAFARQHDRKRHEGLHSGEKKFVCKGTLQGGAQWGCGRRFARADALGRHFRSEAGRVCIKPLLDEEAAERQKAWMEEQQQAQVAAGLVAPQPIMGQPQIDMMGNFLPAALLQQYPALAGIDWNTVPQGPPPEEDYSGRSSFDASSGGEYYDDMSDNEAYQDPQMGGVGHMHMPQNMNQGMNMQTQGGAQGFYPNQTGDYLSDFEGR